MVETVKESFHRQNPGLAMASGKVKGRMTSNFRSRAKVFRRRKDGNANEKFALNSIDVREFARDFYGDIKNPSLPDLCEMYKQAGERFGRTNVVGYKEDIKAAFANLSYSPRSVHLVGLAVHPADKSATYLQGAVSFSTSADFGWTAMPFVFEVVTRVFRVVLQFLVLGFIMMYVDDLLGATSRQAYLHDKEAVVSTITALTGSIVLCHRKEFKHRR